MTSALTYTGDGNAFSILGYCQRIIESDGRDGAEYFRQATAGGYNDLLAVSSEWTGVDFSAYVE